MNKKKQENPVKIFYYKFQDNTFSVKIYGGILNKRLTKRGKTGGKKHSTGVLLTVPTVETVTAMAETERCESNKGNQ